MAAGLTQSLERNRSSDWQRNYGTVPNRYLASDGVIFSNLGLIGAVPEGGLNAENLDGYDGSYNANGNTVYLSYPNNVNPFTMTFMQPVSKVGSFLGIGKEGAVNSLTISVYGVDDNLLDMRVVELQPYEDPQNREGFWGISLGTDVISRVTILNNNPINFGNALTIDDISFSRVDAPSSLPGDYDQDHDVDGRDFLVWQRSFGAPAIPIGSGADGDRSGAIDAGDLAVWENNYGTGTVAFANSGASAATAVASKSASLPASAFVYLPAVPDSARFRASLPQGRPSIRDVAANRADDRHDSSREVWTVRKKAFDVGELAAKVVRNCQRELQLDRELTSLDAAFEWSAIDG